MNITKNLGIAALLCVGLSTSAIAMAGPGERNANLAQALGVSEALIETCFVMPDEKPTERPSKEDHEAMTQERADCLGIEANDLHEVMKEIRDNRGEGRGEKGEKKDRN